MSSSQQDVGASLQALAPPARKTRSCKCLLVLLLIVLIILITGAALAWYFLDYRVWVLESRVQQQYIICLSILNRNFSADLSSHTSPAFKREAKGVQN
ncbi:hypothetical protein D4764_0256300, partial [Takifugu flavidus]